MRKILNVIACLLGVSLFVVGCESNDCLLTSDSYCRISFVDAEGKAVQINDTLTVSLNLAGYDSLFIYRCDTDTVVSPQPIDSLAYKGYGEEIEVTRKQGVLLNRKVGAKEMDIPLSYTVGVDTFFLQYSDRLADTLWVWHENLPYFTSMECGTVMHYALQRVESTRHLIDSVRVVDAGVTNTLRENVKIYYTVSN